MWKKRLTIFLVCVFLASIFVPNSFILAESEMEQPATEEVELISAEAEEANSGATGDSGGNLIYYLVVGYIIVTCVGMYALTEGTRNKSSS